MLALIGTYSVNNSLFEVGSCIAFGILGWILKRYGYPPAPVVLGIVLGKLIELSLFYPLIRAGWRRFRQPSR